MNKFTYGMSFSAKYAREMVIDPKKAYSAMLRELKPARVRLMSYWDEIEISRGSYDFKELDWQIAQAEKHKVKVSLCLGMRQPRWPECHMPSWSKQLEKSERNYALYRFLEQVVEHYKNIKMVESWQLENEALNKGIGLCEDYDRKRLQQEYDLVKKLDPSRPIIMSTSDTIGLPLRKPRPDIIGFSIYLSQHRNSKYYFSKLPAWWYRLRKYLIVLLLRRPVIIHELQAEPWGPQATHKLSVSEQAKSMDSRKLKKILSYAKKTGMSHIDLWGAEWWYWRKVRLNDDSCWEFVKNAILQDQN
jgi:hypothetical protein